MSVISQEMQVKGASRVARKAGDLPCRPGEKAFWCTLKEHRVFTFEDARPSYEEEGVALGLLLGTDGVGRAVIVRGKRRDMTPMAMSRALGGEEGRRGVERIPFTKGLEAVMAMGGHGERRISTESSFVIYPEPDAVVAAQVQRHLESYASSLRTLFPSWDLTKAIGDDWWALDISYGRPTKLQETIGDWPHLAGSLARAWRKDDLKFASAVTDGRLGMLIADVVNGHGRARPGLVRQIGEAHRVYAGMVDDGFVSEVSLTQALSITTALPGHWLPDGDAEWRAYLRVSPLLAFVVGEVNGHEQAFLGFDGSWVSWEDKLARASGALLPGGCLGLLKEHAHAFAKDVIVPTICQGGHLENVYGTDRIAWILLNSGRSLRRCVEEAVRWKSRETTLRSLVVSLRRKEATTVEWQACLPDQVRGDLCLTVLTTGEELVDEGRHGTNPDGSEGLWHCVGGYDTVCQRGHVRIVSIRRGGTDARNRAATCEIVWKDDVPRLTQTRAKGNASPPPDVMEAVEGYVRDVCSGLFGPVPGRPGWSEGYSLRADERASYDPDLDDNWEVVMAAWRPLIPPALRAAPPQDWIDLVTSLEFGGPSGEVPWLSAPVELDRQACPGDVDDFASACP